MTRNVGSPLDQEIEGSNPSSPANIPNLKRPPEAAPRAILIGSYPTPYPLSGAGPRPEDAVHPLGRTLGFDQNVTAFRGEEELGFTALPNVATGKFVKILGL